MRRTRNDAQTQETEITRNDAQTQEIEITRNDAQTQELYDAVDSLRNRIRVRRVGLAATAQIQNQWPLESRSDVDSFISRAADDAGLSEDEKGFIKDSVEELLNGASGVMTVAFLEGTLLDLQSMINDQLLQDIIESIEDYETRIQNATRELKEAIERLITLNEIFGTIIIAVNLVAAIVAASGSKFDALFKLSTSKVIKRPLRKSEIPILTYFKNS